MYHGRSGEDLEDSMKGVSERVELSKEDEELKYWPTVDVGECFATFEALPAARRRVDVDVFLR